MSKLLVNLFMLKTRFVVNTYTVTTLPLYYVIQKPWRTLEDAKRLKTKKFMTSDGELVWTRSEKPVSHSFLRHKSYAEVIMNLKNDYDPNREVLGQREVIRETVEKDENGNIVKVDGKVLRKFVLSDKYKWWTLNEAIDRADNIAKGLVKSGVKKGDKVIIWADTRLEWTLSSLALVRINATLTTLFSNLGIPGLIYGINQTEAETIITTFDLLPKLKSFLSEVPNIKSIIYIKNKNNELTETFPPHISVKSLQEVEESGAQNHDNIKFELPTDLNETAVIMYTSGTTGNPKAVCISHKSLMASIRVLLSNTKDLSEEADKHLYMSYLPLAHILGFTFEMFLFFGGVKIGYSSPFTITDSSPGLAKGQICDAKLLKPTSMTAVPLVLDRILKEIYEKLNARTAISAPLFTYLMEYKIRWKARGYDTPIINRLMCRKIAEAVGGHLEYIMIGGAPLNPRTQAFIKAALNLKQISQGYGATETCGGVIAVHLDDLTYGKVGIPLEGVNIKMIDWKEGGYLTTDKPNPRGEIVIGSDIVALGYYKLPDMTEEAFYTDKEGVRWFHTGDVAEVFPDGSFKIIDRKKDLAKLSNGEFVSLGKIESLLKSCKLVENICVVPNSERNYVIALVTPNQKSLMRLAEQLGRPKSTTREELCRDPEICDKVLENIHESSRESGLHKIETPLRVKLCAEEWTADNNLITAAFKLKRNNVISHYKNDIKLLFDSIDNK